jgi:hypothetical protein
MGSELRVLYFAILLLQKSPNFNRRDICTGFRNTGFFCFQYLVKETGAITTSEVKLEFAEMIVYCSSLSYFYDLTNWVTWSGLFLKDASITINEWHSVEISQDLPTKLAGTERCAVTWRHYSYSSCTFPLTLRRQPSANCPLASSLIYFKAVADTLRIHKFPAFKIVQTHLTFTATAWKVTPNTKQRCTRTLIQTCIWIYF